MVKSPATLVTYGTWLIAFCGLVICVVGAWYGISSQDFTRTCIGGCLTTFGGTLFFRALRESWPKPNRRRSKG